MIKKKKCRYVEKKAAELLCTYCSWYFKMVVNGGVKHLCKRGEIAAGCETSARLQNSIIRNFASALRVCGETKSVMHASVRKRHCLFSHLVFD